MPTIHYAIRVSNLTKTFSFPVKDPARGWVKNLFFPKKRTITAVDDVSFSVSAGERIAFIGPNGAGKSTTIKMLTGILFPSEGEIRVLGLDPTMERKRLAYRIGTVFGQRSQLLPNLPLTDSFEFFAVMYGMSRAGARARTDELVKRFNLSEFIDQPVRKLSLGQRMRAEVAVALIHRPEIIFLDEPTIGLDVVAKKALRDLLLTVNREERVTVFLTSHDVGDIESLCERTIVVNHGKIINDLPTRELSRSYAFEKYVDLIPQTTFADFPKLPMGIVYTSRDADKITIMIDVNTLSVQHALKKLLPLFDVKDVDVYDIELETVIRHMYERSPTRI